MDNMQPGQVIVPHNSDDPQPAGDGAPRPIRPAEEPGPGPELAPNPNPTPEPESVAFVPGPVPAPSSAAPLTPGVDAPYAYSADPVGMHDQLPDEIAWTTDEFVSHGKGAGWYGMVLLAGLIAATLDYLLTKDKISTVIILFVAVAFMVYAARKPHTLDYLLTHQGIQIGGKVYDFREFKNFSIVDEGVTASVVLMPLKRFMPALTLHVTPDVEDGVIVFLSELLPFERHRGDVVDGLMRRIRF